MQSENERKLQSYKEVTYDFLIFSGEKLFTR